VICDLHQFEPFQDAAADEILACPGAGAVQAARAARHAHRRRQAMNPQGEAYLRWYYDTAVWKHLSYQETAHPCS
jgi:hypothetical protein